MRHSSLSNVRIPSVPHEQFRSRVNSRVLIRGGKVGQNMCVYMTDCITHHITDHQRRQRI